MMSKRKQYSAGFKGKMALEALRGELTTARLAAKHSIHPTMVGDWKRLVLEGLTSAHTLPIGDSND
jgi:transposase